MGKPGHTKMRAKRRMWSEEEECSLREGVLQHGEGRWKKIQRDPAYPFLRTNRSSVDLKDKWRVISRKRRKLEEQNNAQPSTTAQKKAAPEAGSTSRTAARVSKQPLQPVSKSTGRQKRGQPGSKTRCGRSLGLTISPKDAELLAHQHTTETQPHFWLQWDNPSAQDHDRWYKVHVRSDNPAGMPAGWTLLHIFADFCVDEAFNLVSYAALGRLRRLRRVSKIDAGVPKNPERNKDGATATQMAAVRGVRGPGDDGADGLAGDAAAVSSDMSTDGSIGARTEVSCSGGGSEHKLDDKERWPVPPNTSNTAAIGVFPYARSVSVSGDDGGLVSNQGC